MSDNTAEIERMTAAHGIMFHHFCDDRHPRGQGAISAGELEDMIAFVGRDHILPAGVWQERAQARTLTNGDLCLTFDDNLRCQFDVALPVLRRHGITAFWFVYTSVFEGNLERLELYRLFRTLYYPTVNRFYDAFFEAVFASGHGPMVRTRLDGFQPADFLREFPFYTNADRSFRFVRDEVLGESRYFHVMDEMMALSGVDARELSRELWMDEAALQALHGEGHVVGLHSHTHPTRLGGLSAEQQRIQYATNHAVLSGILGEKPTTMSHPCNSYSADTEPILRSLGIRMGFRANLAQAHYGMLEHPREDHANLLKRMAA
jgi:peptidoglycan/xylan/chitin deacetylase (PgdA/CDA1 family)